MRPCSYPGCPLLVIRGKCLKHEAISAAQQKKDRDQRSSLYWSTEWRKASKEYLTHYPVCISCNAPATCVDHITAHKGDLSLFWDPTNWQPMCRPCHSKKTCHVDGGFAHESRPLPPTPSKPCNPPPPLNLLAALPTSIHAGPK